MTTTNIASVGADRAIHGHSGQASRQAELVAPHYRACHTWHAIQLDPRRRRAYVSTHSRWSSVWLSPQQAPFLSSCVLPGRPRLRSTPPVKPRLGQRARAGRRIAPGASCGSPSLERSRWSARARKSNCAWSILPETASAVVLLFTCRVSAADMDPSVPNLLVSGDEMEPPGTNVCCVVVRRIDRC